MKNRILAALLALVLGVPLYLLAADAVPTAAAKTVSSAAPAQAVALLKALPSAEDLAAAMTPETDAAAMIAQTRADLQREIERQTGPKGIDLSWWQSHYNDIIGYVYSPGTPISYPIAYDGNNEYYLHHDLYGNYSEYGTIFLDARVPSDFSGHNNVLYGHHMSDGSMFASISAAAVAEEGKVVGVDVDQSGESTTVITSAMKGLADSAQWALGKFYAGEFASIGGVQTSLGANENAVGLPTATWSLTKWSVDSYKVMLQDIKDGKIAIDNNYDNLAGTENVTLNIVG